MAVLVIWIWVCFVVIGVFVLFYYLFKSIEFWEMSANDNDISSGILCIKSTDNG